MRTKIPGILKDVMTKYIDEEDLVSELLHDGSEISFQVDLIDQDLLVNIVVVNERAGQYEVRYGEVDRKVRNKDFGDFLTSLLDEFLKTREEKIAEYGGLETPAGGDRPRPFGSDSEEEEGLTSDEEEGLNSDSEEEGEEGGFVISVSADDFGMTAEEDDRANMTLLREAPYLIVSPSDLIAQQQEAVERVAERMFMSQAGAKIVLRAYKWKVEGIMNRFLDHGRDRVLQDVGLSSSDFERHVDGIGDDDWFECPACFDDVKGAETTFLDACGHRFCNTCWKMNLTVKIQDGLAKRILCMGRGCKCAVDETLVARFITDVDVRKRYDSKVLESFVEDNENMNWCQSAPFCGNAALVRISPKTPLEIHCDCNKVWCFVCLDNPHLPASCPMVQTWKRKCADDSETLRWIQTNTRVCPQCKKSTEKNGGCNHISCTCGAHWCWACGGNFTSQTVYSHSCNKYLEQPDGQRDATQEALNRYLHYFNHYDAHSGSIKNQKRQRMKMELKMQEVFRERPNSAWVEVEWLQNSLEVLFDTRRALMWSYAFAFYLFDKTTLVKEALVGCRNFRRERDRISAKNLFEDKQDVLEKTVELLNKKLDLPLKQILLERNKQQIMSQTVLAEKYLHALFDVIREEMVVEGEFRLPAPRFIVTAPRYEAAFEATNPSAMQARATRTRPPPDGLTGPDGRKSQDELMAAQAASLGVSVDEFRMQQVLMKSYQ